MIASQPQTVTKTETNLDIYKLNSTGRIRGRLTFTFLEQFWDRKDVPNAARSAVKL